MVLLLVPLEALGAGVMVVAAMHTGVVAAASSSSREVVGLHHRPMVQGVVVVLPWEGEEEVMMDNRLHHLACAGSLLASGRAGVCVCDMCVCWHDMMGDRLWLCRL